MKNELTAEQSQDIAEIINDLGLLGWVVWESQRMLPLDAVELRDVAYRVRTAVSELEDLLESEGAFPS